MLGSSRDKSVPWNWPTGQQMKSVWVVLSCQPHSGSVLTTEAWPRSTVSGSSLPSRVLRRWILHRQASPLWNIHITVTYTWALTHRPITPIFQDTGNPDDMGMDTFRWYKACLHFRTSFPIHCITFTYSHTEGNFTWFIYEEAEKCLQSQQNVHTSITWLVLII